MPDVLVKGRPIQSLSPISHALLHLSFPYHPIPFTCNIVYGLHVSVKTCFVTILAFQVFRRKLVRDDCPEKSG